MTKKYNTYEIKIEENEEFELVEQLFVNGEKFETAEENTEDAIEEWEWKNNAMLVTKERAAELEKIGYSRSAYNNLQTEGHGYGEEKPDIQSWL